MDIKLVAFDLDGTALTSDGAVPPGLLEQIARLHKAGITCAAASARPIESIHELFAPVADILAAVACDGHEVYCGRQRLLSVAFDPQTVFALRALVETLDDVLFIPFVRDRGPVMPQDLTPDMTVIKIALYGESGAASILEALCSRAGELSRAVDFVATGPKTIACRLPGHDKASGLELLAAHLGCSLSQVLAMGDNDNDIEMLRAARIGVAVADATLALKAAADRVSPRTCDQGAVERELARL